MAKQKPPTRSPTVHLEGWTDSDERPDVQIAVYDGAGRCVHAAPVKDDGSYSIPDAARKKAARYVLGPAHAGEEAADTAYTLRPDAFAALEAKGVVAIGRAIWLGWIPYLRCATGSVRRCRPGPWWYAELAAFATRVEPTPLEARRGMDTASPGSTIPRCSQRLRCCTGRPRWATGWR